MSKLIHIFFTLYFTLVSSGVLFGKHICGDSVSLSLYGICIDGEEGCCCDHDSINHQSHCCNSETKILKADIQKVNTPLPLKIWKSFNLNLLNQGVLKVLLIDLPDSNIVVKIIHPPPKTQTALFIFNRNLLI